MKRHTGVAAILMVAFLLAIGACKRDETPRGGGGTAPPVAAPAPAPAATPAPGTAVPMGTPPVQPERAVLDTEVRRHWRAVEVAVREKKQGGAIRTLEIALDGEAAVPGTPLTVKILGFVPDFAMGADSITSKSLKDVNPAVKIQIVDAGKELFKGWAFRDFPEMHSFEDPRYTVQMTRAIAAGN